MKTFYLNRKRAAMLLSVCLSVSGLQANVFSLNDARSVGLGNLQSLSHTFTNPAFLSWQDKASTSVTVLNRFGIKELNTGELSLLLPNKFIDCGFAFAMTGFDYYKEYIVKTGFAKKLSQTLSGGINIRYTRIGTGPEIPVTDFFSGDAGIWKEFSGTTTLCLLVQGISGEKIKDTPVLFIAGLKYLITGHLLLACEYNLDTKDYTNFSTGLEYELSEMFFIRCGILTNPGQPCFGTGLSWSSICFDIGFSIHPVLGVSTTTSVNYHF